jgi:hypothetical protein
VTPNDRENFVIRLLEQHVCLEHFLIYREDDADLTQQAFRQAIRQGIQEQQRAVEEHWRGFLPV